MARGIGDIEGLPAIAWVAGTGGGLLLTAGVLWLRARVFRDRPAMPQTYRSAATLASNDGAHARGLALVLVALCIVTELLYAGVYVELARWLLGTSERPRISGDLFVWVFLVDATAAGGALYAGWRGARV